MAAADALEAAVEAKERAAAAAASGARVLAYKRLGLGACTLADLEVLPPHNPNPNQ